MKDVQSEKDLRGIEIDEVGISDVRMILNWEQKEVLAKVDLGVILKKEQKGTHMSRLAEILESLRRKEMDKKEMVLTLKKTQRLLNSQNSFLNFKFIYFKNKKSPISEKSGEIDYDCEVKASLIGDGFLFEYGLKVPMATLCPCSREISDFGAHNQRAEIDIELASKEFLKLDELIGSIETKSSGELFSVLKRSDEKFMTEKMFENPMFVEDVVREVALLFNKDDRIKQYKIKCKSFESIHNHNAFAVVKK